jgi:hypothetical protein
MADYVRISKTLSYWLRHQPDAASLMLDPQGWTNVDNILAGLSREGLPNDIDTLLALVEQSDKQRFELSADLQRIRARQGHSMAVDLALAPTAPPEVLYHGTVDRFLTAILSEGLAEDASTPRALVARCRDRGARWRQTRQTCAIGHRFSGHARRRLCLLRYRKRCVADGRRPATLSSPHLALLDRAPELQRLHGLSDIVHAHHVRALLGRQQRRRD